jgi:hypothetical protein
MITIDNIYDYLETNKQSLNFKQRDDVVTECGVSRFQTLFWDDYSKDMPIELREFLIQAFKITEKDYSFLQIQKYEIGDYILPHKDSYPCFGLLILSTSSLDGIVVQQKDSTYKFFPDIAGSLIDVPKFGWHWVNPVREKTRYTAVYGLNPMSDSYGTCDYVGILDQ